jgi:RNA polymerase sigma factor FliA
MQIQTAHVLSLDDYLPSGEGDESRKIDMLSDPSGESPGDSAEVVERQEFLVQEILALSDQQQKVVNLYYYEELTLKEIGAVLEVSESRISQIHSAAIQKLRKAVRAQRT